MIGYFILIINEYDESSNFINIRNNQITFQQLKFNSLKLHVNMLNRKLNQIPPNNLNQFLIFLESDYIEINNLIITRGFGITDISIQSVHSLQLSQVRILQHKSYQIQGLHQYVDCVESEALTKYSSTSLYLYDIVQISIQDLFIESVTMINNPIIYILSSDRSYTIFISKLYFKNNLILIIDSWNQASILQLMSKSTVQIIIQNSVMENNLMHQYRHNDLINSALLFNFDCPDCIVMDQNQYIHLFLKIQQFKQIQLLMNYFNYF